MTVCKMGSIIAGVPKQGFLQDRKAALIEVSPITK